MIWALAGIIIALLAFGFLNWWARADVRVIRNGLKVALLLGMAIAALIILALIITGRFALIPLLFLIAPLALRISRLTIAGAGDQHKDTASAPRQSKSTMTRAEALEVMGLSEGASRQDIKDAYKKLMAQIHPDRGGTDWMAAKLNEARRILLDE